MPLSSCGPSQSKLYLLLAVLWSATGCHAAPTAAVREAHFELVD